MKKEAMFYKRIEIDGKQTDDLVCSLCPHSCTISEGEEGICRARVNQGGILFAQSYGKITSMLLDPIEKKPLRRFSPGDSIFSIGSYGCNFRCEFCQNHHISMGQPSFREMKPSDIAQISMNMKAHGNIGVAYTYNEPLISYEFVKDCAKLIHDQDQKNVLITNGFIEPTPLLELLAYIDAMNIDLKSFSEEFYKQAGGSLEPVKNTIKLAASRCHVEITSLIIEGKNDNPEEIESMAIWLSEINEEIPLHISRFFPSYKMSDGRATSVETVKNLAAIASKHLKYVYTGNCPT